MIVDLTHEKDMTLTLVKWMVERTRQEGIGRTLKIAANVMMDFSFDWKYGTETIRWVDPSEISTGSINKRHSVRYQATKARPLLKLLRALCLPNNVVFVDIGSGKGRVLLIAAQYGFQKVIGVEFSGELCALARRNVEIYSRTTPLRSPIEVVEADATQYRFSVDERVIFMYNPFDASVLTQVIENLRESLDANPRKMWLIYNTPMHHDVITVSGLFQLISSYEFGGSHFHVYETALDAGRGSSLRAEP